MKYRQEKKKPLNYFERQRKKLHPRKYRFYFPIDYMYYCGEKWGEKNLRMSGMTVHFLYWMFCVVFPLFISPRFLSATTLPLTQGESILLFLASGIIPPILFSVLRYRKERRSALMNHYRRSAWCKGIPVWLVCMGFFPLCAVEVWLMIEMGWM